MATEYITQQGDCWDAIALRLWGDEHLMDRLIAANIEYMDMLEFPAGVRLCPTASKNRKSTWSFRRGCNQP